MTISHTHNHCLKCGLPYCRSCAAIKAEAPRSAPPSYPRSWYPTGAVRGTLRRYPHLRVTGPARPIFVREIHRDMLAGVVLEDRPLAADLKLHVVQLCNVSKCSPPLTPAELAVALRASKASDDS